MRHLSWLLVPSITLLVATATAHADMQGDTVVDEVARLVGILVPLVAALLSPLIGAIVFLFHILVGEMRANRKQTQEFTEKLVAVVSTNTAAFESSTDADKRLTQSVEQLQARFDRIEQHEREANIRDGWRLKDV